ncbi:MAG: hypothetical protein ACRC5R_02115 [Mycoplasmatales bacterium]
MYLVIDEKCKNVSPNKKYLNSNKKSMVKPGFRIKKQPKIKGRKKQREQEISNNY